MFEPDAKNIVDLEGSMVQRKQQYTVHAMKKGTVTIAAYPRNNKNATFYFKIKVK